MKLTIAKKFADTPGQRTMKPGFRLFRYFLLISLAAIVMILLVAGLGLRFILQRFVLSEAEKDAIRISKSLRDCEMKRFVQLSDTKGQPLVVHEEEIAELDSEIRPFLAPFNIVKIKVFDTNTQIIYSTDTSIIGRLNKDNVKLATALSGTPTSKYETAEHVWDLADEQHSNVKIVETYVPIRGLDGKIIGSFEVYKDITNDLVMAGSTLIYAEMMLSVTVLSIFTILLFMMYFAARAVDTSTTALTAANKQLQAANQQLESEIAERKQAEEKIHQQNEFLNNILESLTHPFYVIDANDYTIKMANSAAKFGSLPENLTCYALTHKRSEPCDGEDNPCPLKEIKKTKKPVTVEHVHYDKDGNPRNVEVNAYPIFDSSGNVCQVIEYTLDITNRKQAEEAVEVSNRDLTLAVNKLEEANRELKDFVYIASHDLREPMRKISSFGELLKDSLSGNLNADDQENLEFMIDGANRMTAMIDGLLTYSRIATKGATFETVDLNEIVEQLEQLELAALLEETDAAIEVPQPLPKVQAEPVQMKQLLQNLIINGIKYRREGIQPRVVIRAEQIADGEVRVEVEDNGIGIAKEYQGDVFKMFKRLHSRQKYEGTGIGLAVCKKVVERHNGQIGVESEAGAGSTFWFTLPVSESSRQEQKKLVSSLET